MPMAAPQEAQNTIVQETMPALTKTPKAVKMAPAGRTRLLPSKEPKNATTKHTGPAKDELA